MEVPELTAIRLTTFWGRHSLREEKRPAADPESSEAGREVYRCSEDAWHPRRGYPVHRDRTRYPASRYLVLPGPPSPGTPPPPLPGRRLCACLGGRGPPSPLPGGRARAGDVGAGGGICRRHRAWAGSGGAECGAAGARGRTVATAAAAPRREAEEDDEERRKRRRGTLLRGAGSRVRGLPAGLSECGAAGGGPPGSCSPRGRAGAPPPAEGAGEALADTAVGARGAPVLRGPGGGPGRVREPRSAASAGTRARPSTPRPGPPPSGRVRPEPRSQGPGGWGRPGPLTSGTGRESRGCRGRNFGAPTEPPRSTPAELKVSLQTPVSATCMHIVLQNVSREFTAQGVTTARPPKQVLLFNGPLSYLSPVGLLSVKLAFRGILFLVSFGGVVNSSWAGLDCSHVFFC